MVAAVGLTVVEPLAAAEVKEPGVMAIVVAPVVTQVRVLPEPELIVVGFAVKELMVGLLGALTVTVAVAVVAPVAFVAVSV
jgi:hypothetical protein